MNLYYLPYHMKSGSIKALQGVLGGLKIKKDGNYAFLNNHLVVNWGTGSTPYWGSSVPANSKRLLNHWSKVHTAVNKLRAFQKLKEHNVPTPEWTTSRNTAKEWAKTGVVICRTLLSSMEGKGIVVATKPSEVVEAPLYTKLFPKDKEYRVHVFKDKVIDFVQKKLKLTAPKDRCKYIRNTANGWIFARQAVELPKQCTTTATAAIKAIGLDFGAVDLAINKAGEIVVFEVNTAPGIEGTTISKYTEAIKQYQSSLEK